MSLGVAIFVIVAAVVLLVLISLINRSTPKGIDKDYFRNEWNDVLTLMKDPKTRPLSIIQADKLLDQALKCSGYAGNSCGERLISAKGRLKNRDAVWAAHKLRNRLVHESLAEPSEKQVKVALKGYLKAFKDLGVL